MLGALKCRAGFVGDTGQRQLGEDGGADNYWWGGSGGAGVHGDKRRSEDGAV